MKIIFRVGMSRVAIMLSICLILEGGVPNYAYKHAYKKVTVSKFWFYNREICICYFIRNLLDVEIVSLRLTPAYFLFRRRKMFCFPYSQG